MDPTNAGDKFLVETPCVVETLELSGISFPDPFLFGGIHCQDSLIEVARLGATLISLDLIYALLTQSKEVLEKVLPHPIKGWFCH